MPIASLKDGTQLHFIKSGSGSTSVIFIHGNLATSIWWEKSINFMSQDITAYAIDLPGSGFTPETGERHSIEYFTQIIQQFIVSQSIDSAVLVGHSMGGGIAQLTALDFPDIVCGLVLVNTMPADGYHQLYESGPQYWHSLHRDRNSLTLTMKIIAQTRGDHSMFDRILKGAANASEQVFLEQPVTMHEANWTERLHEIACPVKFIYGSDDLVLPYDDIERTASAIKNVDIQVIDGCGHSPMLEEPQLLADAISDFVENLSEPDKLKTA